MLRAIAVLLCGALAACSQTAAAPQARQAKAPRAPADANPAPADADTAYAATDGMPPEEQYAALMARCEAAVKREQQKQVANAMLGSALSVAGSFAGVGGAIAGDVVSVGRSLAAAGAENSARTAIEKECTP